MQSLTEMRAMLAERGLRPRKRFGQNFLHDQNKIRMLIDAAAIEPGEVVLEVGPGTGALTESLFDAGAEVIACEIDRDLVAILEDRFADRLTDAKCTNSLTLRRAGSLTIIAGNCLERERHLNPQILMCLEERPFKLVANLPYNVASPLMTSLLIEHDNCRGEFVTIQKEVADRLLAPPSTKAYGPLSIVVRAFAEVTRITTLPPSCFWPEPEVESAMVAIVPSLARKADGPRALLTPSARRDFARFITQLFTQRRKQLGTILGRDRAEWPVGVAAAMRPEALSVEQLVALWRLQQRARETAGDSSHAVKIPRG